MLGISLTTTLLNNQSGDPSEEIILQHYGNASAMLDALQAINVTHIELRDFISCPPMDITAMIEDLWMRGFTLSIHGRLMDTILFDTYYAPFLPLLDQVSDHQNDLLLVVHALADPHMSREENALITTQCLRRWCDETVHRPIRFALELNQHKKVYDPAIHFPSIAAMIDDLPHDRVGLCWDMGHDAWNRIHHPHQNTDPTPDMLQRIIHTHIHGLGQNGRPHFGLYAHDMGDIPSHIYALQQSAYSGIYHLELGFDRMDVDDIVPSIQRSVACLQQSINASSHPSVDSSHNSRHHHE